MPSGVDTSGLPGVAVVLLWLNGEDEENATSRETQRFVRRGAKEFESLRCWWGKPLGSSSLLDRTIFALMIRSAGVIAAAARRPPE